MSTPLFQGYTEEDVWTMSKITWSHFVALPNPSCNKSKREKSPLASKIEDAFCRLTLQQVVWLFREE